jgi:N-acetylmuramoyl-L-alanine amidase
VGWRGAGCGALGAACLIAATAGPGAAVELREIDVRPAIDGAVARLVLSAPAHPSVRVLATDGSLARLYVDLPRGTRVGASVRALAGGPAPVARVRVGVADGGVLRVVFDLDGASAYRVRRAGRTVTVALAPATSAPAPVTPPAPPAARVGLRAKIVLDPGHGGTDPGAEGVATEKDVTLDVARRVAQLLEDRMHAEVVLTRSGDNTVPLAARTARANAEGADLFVSIHANAARSRRLHGIETYYLNNTADRASIRLAAMENGLDMITPRRDRPDLRFILSDLVQVGKMEESIALATAIQRSVVGRLRGRWGDVADLGVKRGPFYVLVGAYMPCVLVETSFLTHPTEGRRLAGAAYRQAVAEGIAGGIGRFLGDGARVRTL